MHPDCNDCTEDDYVPVFGACEFDQASGTYRRLKQYSWIVGTKCDHYHSTLPESSYVECPVCNPGMYRNSDGVCVSCPDGTASSGAEQECHPCSAGEESMPGIHINQWYRAEELPSMTTGCTGDCGSNGWVLNGTSLVSGWGHGSFVETFVQFNFTTLRKSRMIFNYSVICPSWDCRLSVYDVGHSSSAYYIGKYNEASISLIPGDHTVRFVYTRAYGETGNNYAEINSISIYGSTTLDGTIGTGGVACSKCSAGYISSERNGWCEACPAGSSSNPERTQCEPCPEDTFNDADGGVCENCGVNVHSDVGSTKCNEDCRFSNSEGVTFDLSPLQKDTMYGPIYDSEHYTYYINLCSRFNATRSDGTKKNAPCKTYYEEPIESYACLISSDCIDRYYCTDYIIGSKLDIYPLDDNKGFNLTYSGLNHMTNVTMMCNPAAGVGAPGPWPGKATIETYQGSRRYDILWESIYGCPVCSENDYTFVYGECKNGFRRKMYQWRTNPRACHDGVSLPPDEDVPSQCNAEVVCPIGHYYNEQTANCTPCGPGTYSPGAGYAYYSFSSIPERFTSSCGSSGACAPFFTSAGKLHSGLGNSVLTYTSQFFVDGFVSFTYSLISTDPYKSTSSSKFNVFLDGVSVFGDLYQGVSLVASRQLSFPVTAGSHMITFEIDAFSIGSYVEIEKMFIYGDRYAPLYCPVCGEGLIQTEAAGGMCSRCSDNTVANDNHTLCVPCDDGKYTIDCKTCIAKAACTEENYVALYTPCRNGKRSLRYVKVEPAAACQGGYVPPEDQENLACAPCPHSMHREPGSDECVGCEAGKFYDADSDSCVEARDGTIAQNSISFFGSESSGETDLPDGWSTCSIMSSFPNGTIKGWRVGNGFVDCGANTGNGRYTSVLQYKTSEVATDLILSFEYFLSDDARLRGSALQLFVNDKLYDYVVVREAREGELFVQSSPVTIPYSESVTIRFVASVWTANLNSVSMKDSDVKLRNVVISGLKKGASKEQKCSAGMQSNSGHTRCVSCQAGTSNDKAGQMCTECEQGTYTSVSGEETCRSCYPGTNSQLVSGSVRCVTSCYFNSTNNTYNMTGLAGKLIGPVTSLSTSRQFYLSVCDGVMKPGECNTHSQGESQIYVCSPGEGSERLNFGSELEFVDSASNESDTTVVLKYHVSNPRSDSSVCGDREVLSTIIFRCDPSVGAGFPTLLPSDECSPTFTWTSQYACRECDRNDYEESLSKCEGGTQRRELYLKSSAKCNGESRIILETVECTDLTVSLGVVLGVIGLIIILAGVIVFVVWRNRAITVKYTKLLQSQEGDLEAMADEEAEAERERKEASQSTLTATF